MVLKFLEGGTDRTRSREVSDFHSKTIPHYIRMLMTNSCVCVWPMSQQISISSTPKASEDFMAWRGGSGWSPGPVIKAPSALGTLHKLLPLSLHVILVRVLLKACTIIHDTCAVILKVFKVLCTHSIILSSYQPSDSSEPVVGQDSETHQEHHQESADVRNPEVQFVQHRMRHNLLKQLSGYFLPPT